MFTRLLLTLLLACGGWAFSSSPSHASCVVETTGSYSEGDPLRDDKCDTSGNKKMTLGTLLSGEDVGTGGSTSLIRTSGGAVRSVTVMTGVTTNTTSAAVAIFSGGKTPIAQVSGTGAVTATVSLFGDNDSTTTDGIELCRITLSGTTKHVKGCDVNSQLSADYPFYYATTTNVTGTGATVEFVVAAGIAGTQIGPPGAVAYWSCGLSNIGTTLTECQPAPGAGLKLYVTDTTAISNTSTGGLWTLRYGTGTNCGTGTGNVFFGSASALLALAANTSTAGEFEPTNTPFVIPANNALCVLGVVTNTTNIQINGYIAP